MKRAKHIRWSFARGARAERAFTLVEVAITILIVGIGLLLVMQGLNVAKITAAHTRNYKLSRDLALLTLGRIEAGEYQKDIESGLTGTYADQGYPDFVYEVIVGDASFREKSSDDRSFDSWAPTQAELDQKEKDKNTDKDEQKEEPFEKVKIRITFPKMAEYSNELVLERWMPWTQVYGQKEDSTQTAAAGASSTSGNTSGTTPNTSTGR